MRQPMEEMYGAEVFANMWEAWVDGISEYTHRPEGRHLLALAFFKSGYEGKEYILEENQRETASFCVLLLPRPIN